MSFILDALKKSEAERQRQSVPGLLDLPAQTPKPRFPVWGIWIGVLLGVNLLVLLVVLIRSSGSNPPVPAAQRQPAAATPFAAPAAALPATAAPAGAGNTAPAMATAAAPAVTPVAESAGFSPMEGQPVYAPEIPVADSAATQAAVPGGAYPPPAALPAARPPLPPQARIPPDPNEVVPSLQEVILSGNRGIPELHLDIHVYAAKPAGRFVFINNRKYREGATLQEGPTVEHITRDGVILSYQNLRFSIPRL